MPIDELLHSMLRLTSLRGLTSHLYTKNGLLRALLISPCLLFLERVDDKGFADKFRITSTYHPMMSDPVAVPRPLVKGVPMMKISSKKMKQVTMKLEDGCITWAGSSSKGQ